jgi:peroxiredoxin (alkyl hydroperoxide reductase subunit C)
LIGEKAPSFSAESTQGEIRFPEDYEGRWVVFFSHPADFTPVCTTEFMAFASRLDEFRDMNCELLGLSIDSTYSHIAWLRTIKERIDYRGMRDVDISFPVISDLSMSVSRKYGMIHPEASSTQAVRAVFLVDPSGIVRALLYYPLTTGRNLDEIKRMVQALQLSDAHNVATPVNWLPGDDVIIPPPGSCGTARERVSLAGDDYRCLDWFLCLKRCPRDE